MKKLGKILVLLASFSMLLTLVGCSKESGKQSDTPDVDLTALVDTLYEGVEEKPMVGTTEINKDNLAYYVGTDDIDFEEGVASEAEIGSIAHSVALLKVKEGTDVETAKAKIQASIDPRKWICVEAEKVIVENKGDLIIVIMSFDDVANTIESNFSKL